MLDSLPDHVELALELGVAFDRGTGRGRSRSATDEDLLEDWLDGDRARTDLMVVGRDVAPAKDELALVDDDLFEDRLDPLADRRVARKEH